MRDTGEWQNKLCTTIDNERGPLRNQSAKGTGGGTEVISLNILVNVGCDP